MIRLFHYRPPFLLFGPLSPPGIIESQYRCVKLNAVDQDGARCQVKLNIVQGQREWHSGHSGIFPAARYHGVSVEDLPSDCIDFRLWNGREI
ncbi:hypothetical protein SM82_01190 [Klebsiella pneumoniae]|nr:hypothetical protein SM82_01190 [Klebsiella pneumoniae]